MQYRVTIGLGQDSVEAAVLETRAAALRESVAGLDDGGGATVVVDPVKAVTQLVVPLDAVDGLAAVERAVHLAGQGLADAGLAAPASIVTIEAEAVPAASAETSLPHQVQVAGPS